MTDYYKLAKTTGFSIIKLISTCNKSLSTVDLIITVADDDKDIICYWDDNCITKLAFEMGLNHSWISSRGNFSGVVYSSNEYKICSVIYTPNQKLGVYIDNELHEDCTEEQLFQLSTTLNSKFSEYIDFWKGIQSLSLDFPVVFNEICKDRLEQIKLILEEKNESVL